MIKLKSLLESLSRYTTIATIKNSNVDYAHGDWYILIENPFKTLTDISDIRKSILVNREPDGTGSTSPFYKEFGPFIKMLPKYKNTPYQWALTTRPPAELKRAAAEIMSTINTFVFALKNYLGKLRH